MPYTDVEILAISQRMDSAAETGLLSCIKACAIGASCTDMHIVSVAVHPGFEKAPRNIDLYVEEYTEPDVSSVPDFRRLEGNGAHCIRRYPYNAARAQRFFWTIYAIDHKRETSKALPKNQMYDNLKARDDNAFAASSIRSVWGNIMVVKSNRMGVVTDVEERDLYFIETLVHSFFEDDNVWSVYPVIVNPMVKPEEPRDGGWSSTRGWGN